jgi:hypothetical protein
VFDLTRPCVNCPFRVGQGSRFQLAPERLQGIINAVAFQCHKTVDYSDEEPRAGDKPQQCAGLMAVLHRSNRHNQIMQVAERLGAFDSNKLDPEAEAYASIEETLAAHAGKEPDR